MKVEGLGINWPTLVAQLVNFTILLLILYFAAYKPILKMLDQRSTKIKESMDQAEAIKQQTVNTEKEIKTQLDAARKEGLKLVEQSSLMGEKLKEEAKKEARQEAENLVAKAKIEISRERDETIEQLRKEFINVAVSAAEKVIEQSLDKEKHRHIIEEVLKENSVLKKS